jgi:hypothetical protein
MKQRILLILTLLKQVLATQMDNFSREQLEQALEHIENILETE